MPKHVCVIMDGNGRWAKNRQLPRLFGHSKGVETAIATVKAAMRRGIETITLYAFSTENWKRPKVEVDGIFKLLIKFFESEIEDLHNAGIKVKMIGDRSKLSKNVLEVIEKGEKITSKNTGITALIAINYGGRAEIEKAIKEIAQKCLVGDMKIDDVDQNIINSYLYTKDYCEPELFIRTGGEIRLSNFLLWQVAYSEMYFTDTLWPDFSEKDLDDAILFYMNRERRFGDVKL